MRDLLVTLLVFGSLPLIMMRPYTGVLVWSWLSYMNPHRLTWSYAYDMPFAQIVAIVFIASLFLNKEPKRIPVDGLMVVWVCFLIWMSITTLFAINEFWAQEYYFRAMKIQVLTLLTLVCMTNFKRLDLLIWTICLSIGFFSLKGGVFTLVTGGQYRVYGPPQSFIEENNALGLATLMIIPLIWYLREFAEKAWVKMGLTGATLLSVISVMGSHSRGALVAILAVGGYFWVQSRAKLISALAVVLLLGASMAIMPDTWFERMETIRNYQEDPSAMSRIAAWKFSINIANDRLTGGGFNSFSEDTYARYNPEASKAFVAHSIYFSVLAAHGWPGLVMFLMILFLTWRNLSEVVRDTRHVEDLKKYHYLALMLRLSLIAYMAGGAFLSLAYFDLPWHLIAIAYLLKHQLRRKLNGPETAEVDTQPAGKNGPQQAL